MNEIFKSASKVVLILFACASSIAFLGVVLMNLKQESVAMAVIAMFSGAVSSVMTYYFTKRSEKKGNEAV